MKLTTAEELRLNELSSQGLGYAWSTLGYEAINAGDRYDKLRAHLLAEARITEEEWKEFEDSCTYDMCSRGNPKYKIKTALDRKSRSNGIEHDEWCKDRGYTL